MSKARLVITAIETESDAAFEPKSRRPATSPNATPEPVVDLVLKLRSQLIKAGLDAGAETIGWHLEHHHDTTLARSTINRILVRAGTVTPEPKKRPRSSYIRFEAEMPNETWQSAFTHHRLATGTDTESITWLDDHSRYALHIQSTRTAGGSIVVPIRWLMGVFLVESGLVETSSGPRNCQQRRWAS